MRRRLPLRVSRPALGLMSSRRLWPLVVVGLGALALGTPADAAKSHFSKAYTATSQEVVLVPAPPPFLVEAVSRDSTVTVFDVVISLHNSPTGDNDPNKDSGAEQQKTHEQIIRYWADAIYEQTNGAHRLGKVRIFRRGKNSSTADVVWNASEGPRANVAGFGTAGQRITFGDSFPNGCGTGCNHNMLTDMVGAGYTLAHEWGHYVYGLYDEYVGRAATGSITMPRSGDTPVDPSIMNRQWNATGGQFKWLNHSTSNNYQPNTAQGRAYGASGWETLVRSTDDDPRTGRRAALPQRTRYTTLAAKAPTAADTWVKIELPGSKPTAREKLEIIWMQDDIQMQVVVDVSGSMSGTPLTNAKLGARNLVDVVQAGATAVGLVSFQSSVSQVRAIKAIPDPDTGEKTAIRNAINGLTANGATSLFDGASLALTNLLAYKTSTATNANQMVFLLSDGEDNDSTKTESQVVAAYRAASVPLVTLGYGSYAPSGVLKRLADGTGGQFFASPTTVADIQKAFLAAGAQMGVSAAVASSSVTTPGSTGFAIDSTIESFTVFSNFAGGAADVKFAVIGAKGQVVAVPFDCGAVGTSTSCTGTITKALLAGGGAGRWSIQVTRATTGAAIPVNINVAAIPAKTRTYDVQLDALTGTTVGYPSPFVLTATISKDLPITGARLKAQLTAPNGTVRTLDMNDEGRQGDARAGDGTYSCITGYSATGIHRLDVSVDNDQLTAAFTRESFQPAHPSVGTGGNFADPGPLPPLTERFSRTASMQLVVEGTARDNDANVPPGTQLIANNAERTAAIDAAGDVDYFRITGIDKTQDLVVRVTNLALGMRPVLTLYRSDGKTLVATAQPGSGSLGYTSLQLRSSQIDPSAVMVASVKHESASATEGSYAISAGPPVPVERDPDGDGVADANEDYLGTDRYMANTQILSEGATGFFLNRLALVNPRATPADVLLRFLRPDDPPIEQALTIPGRQRATVVVNDVPGLANADVSTVVEIRSGGVVVERTMMWDYRTGQLYGGHTGKSLVAPRTHWFLAEGEANFFETFILLANPGTSAANVTADYLLDDGTTVRRTYRVEANARVTIYANAIPGVARRAFSTSIDSTVPIIVERAMYFTSDGNFWTGGHASAGVTDAATSWFVAEGATGTFFDEYLLLANPNPVSVTASIRFLRGTGSVVPYTVKLPPTSRTTVSVDAVPGLSNVTEVSAEITATLPIVVERAMYWPQWPWKEAHNSAGLTATGVEWVLADGEIGGPTGVSTYVLLANPTSTDATVTLNVLREGGRPPVSSTYTVKANSRRTVDAAWFGVDSGERFGVHVTSTQPIAVERAMYWNAGGVFWSAGTNETGTRLR